MSALGWTTFIYAHTEWYWWLFTIIQHTVTIIIIPLWIIHSIKLYSDLCTITRSSTRWRKNTTDISPSYKLMNSLAYLTLTGFVLTAISLAISQYKIFKDYCRQIIVMVSIFYVTAKLFMYLLFLVKLYLVYKGSAFRYKSQYLILIGIICIIVHVINIILFILYNGINITFYENMPFAMHCNSYYPLSVLLIGGSFDSFMSIYFVYSFVAPIRQIIVKNSDNGSGSASLYHIAIKAIILALVAISSKVLMLTFLFFTNSLLLGPIDVIINFICVLFMTPYYKEKYYTNICCLFIKMSQEMIKKPVKDIENISKSVNSTKMEDTKSTPVGSEMTVKCHYIPRPSPTEDFKAIHNKQRVRATTNSETTNTVL